MKQKVSKRRHQMKGYTTSYGYMGLVDGEYQLFASMEEYYEAIED